MANRRNRSSSSSHTPHSEPASPGGSSGRHPVYHGIRLRAGKWVSEIREPNKTTRIWLGTYPTPEMAAAAYDVASLALKGPDTRLNFPDSVLSNTLPECPNADDIRAAAARAAADRAPVSSVETATASQGMFLDDDEVFGMPSLLSDMAEGMLISPPRNDSSPPEDGPYDSSGGNLWYY